MWLSSASVICSGLVIGDYTRRQGRGGEVWLTHYPDKRRVWYSTSSLVFLESMNDVENNHNSPSCICCRCSPGFPSTTDQSAASCLCQVSCCQHWLCSSYTPGPPANISCYYLLLLFMFLYPRNHKQPSPDPSLFPASQRARRPQLVQHRPQPASQTWQSSQVWPYQSFWSGRHTEARLRKTFHDLRKFLVF